MIKSGILLAGLLFCTLNVNAATNKCFFESDCEKGYVCVTPKGAMNGACQPTTSTEAKDKQAASSISNSIIKDETKCTFNTDCANGGQCIKEPGTLYGHCEGSGYGTQINPSLLDQKRTCFFDQDCKTGQRCTKPQGSFKGVCEDDFFQSEEDKKDPRTLLRNQFRTSNKKCLQDGDCGLQEACLVQERSVFGVCTAKNSITTPALPTSSSRTSDPFKF